MVNLAYGISEISEALAYNEVTYRRRLCTKI